MPGVLVVQACVTSLVLLMLNLPLSKQDRDINSFHCGLDFFFGCYFCSDARISVLFCEGMEQNTITA